MWPMWPALPVGPGWSLPPRTRPPPDAGGDDHAQRVVVTAGRALPVLGRGHRHAVADQGDGQPAGGRAHPLDQRIAAPAGDVDRADRTGLRVHGTRAADAHGRRPAPQVGEAELVRGPRSTARHHRVAVLARGRGPLRAQEDPAAAVHQGAGDLGAADVEGGDEVRVHRVEVSWCMRQAAAASAGTVRESLPCI